MKTPITYTRHSCTHCLKCLKACPTGAISIQKDRVQLNQDSCIACGKCIEVCHHHGITSKGSTYIDKENYDVSIALVGSGVLVGKTKDEIRQFLGSLQSLGFDRVEEISAFEGQIALETRKWAKSHEAPTFSSFCPVVHRLIELNYPTLFQHLAPFDYPSEVASRHFRKQYPDQKVGTFLICGCVAQLALAKYPYGNNEFDVDHALSLQDLHPILPSCSTEEDVNLNLEGLLSGLLLDSEDEKELKVDGLDKVMRVLELAEFGQMEKLQLITCLPCLQGCLGGAFNTGNCFIKQLNFPDLFVSATKPPAVCSEEELHQEWQLEEKEKISFQEKMRYIQQVNHIVERLAQYDCGACGYPTCRKLAEQIAIGQADVSECRILKGGNVHEMS